MFPLTRSLCPYIKINLNTDPTMTVAFLQVVGNCGMYGSMASYYDCCKTIIPCGGVMKNDTTIAYFQNPNYPNTEKDTLSCNINVSIMFRNYYIKVTGFQIVCFY